ncbi:uncharacterized protein BDCG_17878, partial [Blastomyces dermatitidis ER-3]
EYSYHPHHYELNQLLFNKGTKSLSLTLLSSARIYGLLRPWDLRPDRQRVANLPSHFLSGHWCFLLLDFRFSIAQPIDSPRNNVKPRGLRTNGWRGAPSIVVHVSA